ncbi:unnamed protein product [Cyclocybe aegerita]|uniref:Reverse transcriptase domain-containing protein n=1 Tax=Cyclocybe aegerita TaxID=1973307 RepID=A0A8S0VSL0_CYCAE|nr:unnamed protein product [Cyclocybe aegerita]
MNPPDPDMVGFDKAHLAHTEDLASEIPDITSPLAQFLVLQDNITLDDIEVLKAHLLSHSPHSALGLDQVSKAKILDTDNIILLDFNECVHRHGSPHYWLLTLIIGAPKHGKTAEDVKNYCAIALESCLLKALTFIIHTKFCKALNSTSIIPPSQNGFWKNCHTNNNAFVLWTLIDKAASKGKTLDIAFVDISNAFPSTSHSSLWLKLEAYGLTGQYFDWIQMLYSQMTYIIAHNGIVSQKFSSLSQIHQMPHSLEALLLTLSMQMTSP